MRLLPFILCLAAAVDADKLFPGPPRGRQAQNFAAVFNDYLPPKTTCVPSTVVVPTTSLLVVTSTRRSDVVSTAIQTARTTLIRSTVVPTVVIRSSVVTQVVPRVETVVQTSTSQFIASVVRTVTGGRATRTVQRAIVTTQRVIRTESAVSTLYRDDERVRTVISTVVQPTTVVRTEGFESTRIVPFRPPPVVRTISRTNVVQSTTVREGQGVTVRSTVTVPRAVTSTVRSQPPPTFVTRTITDSKVAYTTRTSTSQVLTTRGRTVTRTSVVTQVVTDFQPRATTIFTTQVIPTTVYRTSATTQLRVSTIFNTRTETRFIERPGRVITSTFIDRVVTTVPGRDIVITRTGVTTNLVQRVTTITQGRGRTTTITRTEQQTCDRTGYKYDRPSIAFNLPGQG